MSEPINAEMDAFKEDPQAMFKDELMSSWRTGFSKGLNTAQKMAVAVRNVAVAKRHDSRNDCERAEFDAQIDVLGGLISALETAAAEVVQPELERGEQ